MRTGQTSSASAIANALPARIAEPRSNAAAAVATGDSSETMNVTNEMMPVVVAIVPHVRAIPAASAHRATIAIDIHA